MTTHKEVIQQALEALEYVRSDLVIRAEIDPDDGGAVLDIGNGALDQMDEAISALRAALAEQEVIRSEEGTEEGNPVDDGLQRENAWLKERLAQLEAELFEQRKFV